MGQTGPRGNAMKASVLGLALLAGGAVAQQPPIEFKWA